MSEKPEKPTRTERRLVDLGLIERIGVAYRMESADSGQEVLVINNSMFPWSAWDYLQVEPGFPRSIARVLPSVEEKVKAYDAWLKKEASDMAMYKKLKKKFEE